MYIQGTKEVVGNTATTGPFEKSISLETTGGATTGYTVFVRAFLTNQKGTVYGVVKEFTIPELTISFCHSANRPQLENRLL